MNSACAEVIESSINTFKAHCWHWNKAPQFGSLVTITTQIGTLFGVVYQIQTGSRDPQRVPFPFQKTEEELLREQPQIFAFLATTFTCIVVGYEVKNNIIYQWAAEPPKIHAFVHAATDAQYEHFFACEQYMHILFSLSHQIVHLDELMLAMLKQLSDRKLLTHDQLARYIETLSLLTGNDYRRLKLFLQRLGPSISIQE